MQSQNSGLRSDKRDSQRPVRGRVVSMKSWRQKKRLQRFRGSRTWPTYILHVLAMACLAATFGLAVVGTVPSSFEYQSLLWAWFTGTLGAALSLVLFVRRDRQVRRTLTWYVVALLITWMISAVRVWF